jgi:hypothetical protein
MLQLTHALDQTQERLDYTMNRKVVLLGQKTVGCDHARRADLILQESFGELSRR